MATHLKVTVVSNRNFLLQKDRCSFTMYTKQCHISFHFQSWHQTITNACSHLSTRVETSRIVAGMRRYQADCGVLQYQVAICPLTWLTLA